MFPQQKFTANLLKFMEKMFLIHRIMRSLGHEVEQQWCSVKTGKCKLSFHVTKPATCCHNCLAAVGTCGGREQSIF